MIVPVGGKTFSKKLEMGVTVYQNLKKLLKSKNLSTAVGDEGGFAPNLQSNEEALDLIVEAIKGSNYKLKTDIAIALDIAGTEMFDDPEGLWGLLDLGTVPQQEIIERYCRKYPADEKVIRWFIGHGEYMPVARPAVWELVHELKKQGYGVYLLSNYSEELFKKHTEYADFMNDIDGLIVSYMVHKAKPDPAIYAALCEKYELNPSECLFFDDRLENVQAAISYGMQAKRVLSKEGLVEDLEKIVQVYEISQKK